jgi:hypothetical protein
MVLQQETFVQCWETLPHLELYLALALAVASRAWFFQTPCLAHRAPVRLCPQGTYRVCPERCPLEPAWRVALLAHLAAVRLCQQEMYRVCLQVCLLEVAWLSAHRVHPMAGFPLHALQRPSAEERSWDSPS